MCNKQRLLVLITVLLSSSLISLSSPGFAKGEKDKKSSPGNTIICETPLPGVAIDSAIRYRIIAPGDSVPLSMQVFDQCGPGGKPERSTYFRWNGKRKSWVGVAKEDLLYNREGHLDERQYFQWIDEYQVYSMIEKESFSYQKDQLEKYEYEAYDRQMIGKKIMTHEERYDDMGRLVFQETRQKTDDQGWIDLRVVKLHYNNNGTVTISIREADDLSGDLFYKQDLMVMTCTGEDYKYLLRSVISRPKTGLASVPEEENDRVYYFYNYSDMLADQVDP